jgi:hypothetical protein
MSIVFDSLISILPQQSAAASSAQSAEAVRERLGHFQLVGRGPALRHNHCILCEINSVRMSPAQRLDALDACELAVASFVENTHDEACSTFPLSAECRADAQLVAEIERELAIGYVAAVRDLCAPSGKLPFLRGAIVARALTGAAIGQNARICVASAMCEEPATGVWQSLHDTFRFAVEVNLADREVAVPGAGAKTSVSAIYMQALLLAFVRPNQFTRSQYRQLQDSLPVLASLCKIRPGFAHAGMIAVQIAGDTSPFAARSNRAGTDDSWALDVTALLARLEALLARDDVAGDIRVPGRDGGGVAVLGVDVAAILKRVLSARTERGRPREEDATRLHTETGLTRLHALISGWSDFEAALPDAGFDQTSLPPARLTAVPKPACAITLDSSFSGHRLRWDAGVEANARVGDLIALAPAGQELHRWSYGWLRWLRVERDEAVEAGVELLPATPLAVAVYPLGANDVPRLPVRGVLVDASAMRDGRGDETGGILVPKPFAHDAVAIEVLYMDADTPRAEWAPPVRIEEFTVRNAGVHQMIVLSHEVIARIVPAAADAALA